MGTTKKLTTPGAVAPANSTGSFFYPVHVCSLVAPPRPPRFGKVRNRFQ